MKSLLTLAAILILLTSCSAPPTQPTIAPAPTIHPPTFYPADALPPTAASIPNPASVFCTEQGNIVAIRTAADGSQSGFCIFPDGSECEEWAYFRGECVPSGPAPQTTGEIVNGWMVYRDDITGLSFHYPADTTVEFDSMKSIISINGPVIDNNSWPVFMISYSQDRDEFYLPAGTDLRQWLMDHNLYVDQPQPNVTIAGTTAIHIRFSGGQQSFANDRYYFVHNNQMYVITIIHIGNREDWELYNRFLKSFQFDESTSNDYQEWWTYTHANYGFSIMLPKDWVVEETTTFDPQLSGHILNLHTVEIAPGLNAESTNIRMTFRRTGEGFPLWPTGVGQGEFIQQGALDIAGKPALRMLLICPSGELTSIWYHDADGQSNVIRGGMEFGFIYSANPLHCASGYSLNGKARRVGELIIASLKVP